MFAKRIFLVLLNSGWPFLANVIFLREGKIWFALSGLTILMLFLGFNDLLFGIYYIESYSNILILLYVFLFLFSVFRFWARVDDIDFGHARVFAAVILFLAPTLSSFALPGSPDWEAIKFKGLSPVLEPGDLVIIDEAVSINKGDLLVFEGADGRGRLGYVVSPQITSYGVYGELPAFCNQGACYSVESLCPQQLSEVAIQDVKAFEERGGILAVSNFDPTALNFETEREIFRYIVENDAISGKVVGVVRQPSFFASVTPINELMSSNCTSGG